MRQLLAGMLCVLLLTAGCAPRQTEEEAAAPEAEQSRAEVSAQKIPEAPAPEPPPEVEREVSGGEDGLPPGLSRLDGLFKPGNGVWNHLYFEPDGALLFYQVGDSGNYLTRYDLDTDTVRGEASLEGGLPSWSLHRLPGGFGAAAQLRESNTFHYTWLGPDLAVRDETAVSFPMAHDSLEYLTPDAESVIFKVEEEPDKLYIQNADGTGRRVLLDLDDPDVSGIWSPQFRGEYLYCLIAYDWLGIREACVLHLPAESVVCRFSMEYAGGGELLAGDKLKYTDIADGEDGGSTFRTMVYDIAAGSLATYEFADMPLRSSSENARYLGGFSWDYVHGEDAVLRLYDTETGASVTVSFPLDYNEYTGNERLAVADDGSRAVLAWLDGKALLFTPVWP